MQVQNLEMKEMKDHKMEMLKMKNPSMMNV